MTREEAITELEILKEDYWDDDGYGHETTQYDDTMLALGMAIKSLEQEPKTGHWEYVQYDSTPNIGNWHCSECKGICTEMHSIEDAYDYCPNCGAKMGSEDKE